MSLELLKMREVHLSDDTYDASQSTVAVALKPIDESKWKKFDRLPINMVGAWDLVKKNFLNFANKLH